MEFVASSLLAVGVPPTSSVAPTAGAAAETRAAARFAEIMEAGAPTAVPGATTAAEVGAIVPVAAGNNTLGERILNGLSGASSDFRRSLAEVTSVLDSVRPATTADLLKLQLNLTQVSIQYDLIGKAVGRATQNIDQLLKIQ